MIDKPFVERAYAILAEADDETATTPADRPDDTPATTGPTTP